MANKKDIINENLDFSTKNTQVIRDVKEKKDKKTVSTDTQLSKNVLFPLWLSVSESAKLGGVTAKTIRRALQSQKLTYKILKNRYQIDLRSIIKYLYSKKKLKNKLIQHGIGQYIDKWRD